MMKAFMNYNCMDDTLITEFELNFYESLNSDLFFLILICQGVTLGIDFLVKLFRLYGIHFSFIITCYGFRTR